MSYRQRVQIKVPFDGWHGRTVVTLDDGSRWMQSEHVGCDRRYTSHPFGTLRWTGTDYELRVEDFPPVKVVKLDDGDEEDGE